MAPNYNYIFTITSTLSPKNKIQSVRQLQEGFFDMEEIIDEIAREATHTFLQLLNKELNAQTPLYNEVYSSLSILVHREVIK